MILFFDCETSGLLRNDLPATDSSQPHLVQIGAMLLDEQQKIAGRFACLIKPDGWAIEPEAQGVHGINEMRAVRCGINVKIALAMFCALAMKAQRIVAHNVNFDRKIIDAQLSKIGADGQWWTRCAPKLFCTMENAAPICKIPGEFGFKFPSLEEAHLFFFPDAPFKVLHDAEADLAACSRIYYRVIRDERCPTLTPTR